MATAKKPTVRFYVYEAFDMGNGDWGERHSLGLFATKPLADAAAKGKGGMGYGNGEVKRRSVKG